jgi:CBS domain-containing protein
MGLQEFVDEQLLKSGRRCFLVTDNHRVAGLITQHEVRDIERSRWPLVTVREAMRTVGAIHSLSPDAPAMQALEIMCREDVNQLPIVVDGRLVGIVSRGHLLQVIHTRAELGR